MTTSNNQPSKYPHFNKPADSNEAFKLLGRWEKVYRLADFLEEFAIGADHVRMLNTPVHRHKWTIIIREAGVSSLPSEETRRMVVEELEHRAEHRWRMEINSHGYDDKEMDERIAERFGISGRKKKGSIVGSNKADEVDEDNSD